MSRRSEYIDHSEESSLESAQEALRHSQEFHGPVPPTDAHEPANDHFALLYESRDEELAAAVPFAHQGLKRGEQVLYIVGQNSREEVLDAMRVRDIDVDSVLETGALSVESVQDTYLRNGTFDADEMVDFFHKEIEDAVKDYNALRVVGETNWFFSEEPDLEEFIDYETRLNALFHGEDTVALCPYNRTRFPPEVIEKIIYTHPHLISDSEVFQNVHYMPPDELSDSGDSGHRAGQMMGLLRERTETKAEIQEHKHYLRQLHQTTENSDLSFEETVEELLELGCKRFDLKGGALSYLPAQGEKFSVDVTVGPELPEKNGVLQTQPADGCFCRQAISQREPTAVHDVTEMGWDDDPLSQELGIATYFGIRVTTAADPYGTFWFYDTSPRERPFTDDERTFLELMGQWISNELERSERSRAQRELHQITTDGDRSFEAKVDRLLEMGCDRFGLGMGFLLRKEGDGFQVVASCGSDLDGETATFSPNPGHYGEKTITLDSPVGVEDTEAAGWDDDPLYTEQGLGCYLGTKLTDGTGVFGSLAFADSSPRERTFTVPEYTFLELMGQWLSHELERERREEQLATLNAVSRDLMNTEAWSDIAEKVVDFAESSLNLPTTAIVQYDTSGELSLAAQTAAAQTTLPTAPLCDSDSGPAWESFIANETRVVDEKAELDPLTELIIIPLGNQGVLLTATTATGGFTELEAEFVETMAATVEAAFTRADRERELNEQNTELHRVSQINSIIRGIAQTLVQAETQAEIGRIVCEQFADSELFEFAWVGEYDLATETVKPSEWAGVEPDYLDSLTITVDETRMGQGPIGTAVRTQEVQMVEDIILDPQFAPWREQTLDQGVRSCKAVPLSYEDSSYGVLAVYADSQQSSKQDIELLEELGEAIAYAINTIESTETQQTDSVVELTIEVQQPETTLATLAQRADTRIRFEGLVPAENDSSHVFFTVDDELAGEISEGDCLAAIEEVTLITETDGSTLFRATVSGSLFVPALTAQGGAVRTLTFDGKKTTGVVDLPSTTDVRLFLDDLRTMYPSVELVSRRSCNRPLKSVREIQTAIKEPLTDRQTEVLKMAYLSGFFESPRSKTGQEIADSLDISPPTFTQHLRAGQQKVLSLAFDEE